MPDQRRRRTLPAHAGTRQPPPYRASPRGTTPMFARPLDMDADAAEDGAALRIFGDVCRRPRRGQRTWDRHRLPWLILRSINQTHWTGIWHFPTCRLCLPLQRAAWRTTTTTPYARPLRTPQHLRLPHHACCFFSCTKVPCLHCTLLLDGTAYPYTHTHTIHSLPLLLPHTPPTMGSRHFKQPFPPHTHLPPPAPPPIHGGDLGRTTMYIATMFRRTQHSTACLGMTSSPSLPPSLPTILSMAGDRTLRLGQPL